MISRGAKSWVCAGCRSRVGRGRRLSETGRRGSKPYSTGGGGAADNGRPRLRMAVVGSGPAGLYTAHRVMSRLPAKVDIDKDEALPVPFGLVRFGVAPDHPEVKVNPAPGAARGGFLAPTG